MIGYKCYVLNLDNGAMCIAHGNDVHIDNCGQADLTKTLNELNKEHPEMIVFTEKLRI